MIPLPPQWAQRCGSQCTSMYTSFAHIPWRIFCKKGCDSDGETWEECLVECDEICYKDPVLKDQQWSAYIDRSPGSSTYSEECFRACIAGCGYKKFLRCMTVGLATSSMVGIHYGVQQDDKSNFQVPQEKVDRVQPNRTCKPSSSTRAPASIKQRQPIEDIPCTSA